MEELTLQLREAARQLSKDSPILFLCEGLKMPDLDFIGQVLQLLNAQEAFFAHPAVKKLLLDPALIDESIKLLNLSEEDGRKLREILDRRIKEVFDRQQIDQA